MSVWSWPPWSTPWWLGCSASARPSWAPRPGPTAGWRSARGGGGSRRCTPTRITPWCTPTGRRHDDYYRRLAVFVVDALAAAGIPRCESKVMASEEGWRGPLTWWRQRIEQWMQVPEAKATFLTGIVFDARVVAGELDLEALFAHAVERAAASPGFQARLGRLIVDMEVPVGFLGNLIVTSNGERRTLDIKRGGVHPITEMARLHALRAGVSERCRHHAGWMAQRVPGSLDADTAEALAEAHALLRDLRLTHQTEQYMAGDIPDDLIDPGPCHRSNEDPCAMPSVWFVMPSATWPRRWHRGCWGDERRLAVGSLCRPGLRNHRPRPEPRPGDIGRTGAGGGRSGRCGRLVPIRDRPRCATRRRIDPHPPDVAERCGFGPVSGGGGTGADGRARWRSGRGVDGVGGGGVPPHGVRGNGAEVEASDDRRPASGGAIRRTDGCPTFARPKAPSWRTPPAVSVSRRSGVTTPWPMPSSPPSCS
jgi:hypothetical protein